MPLQPVILLLAGIGFFGHIGVLFIIGAILAIILDIYGIFTGKLNFLFPLVLYIGGFILFGGWYGILWGAVIGSAIEMIIPLIMLLGGGTFILFDKIRNKRQIDKI